MKYLEIRRWRGKDDSSSLVSSILTPYLFLLYFTSKFQFLNWKFGRSLEEEDLKLGFCMHFMQDPDITNLEWRFEGMRIRGGGNGKRLFWINWSHYELLKK